MVSDNVSNDGTFYHRANGLSFSKQCVGLHTLEKIVPKMMLEIGSIGRYTLHSLRTTCATRLYGKGLEEQRIAEITGHTSSAIRGYKRTSVEQKEEASQMLQTSNKVLINNNDVSIKVNSDSFIEKTVVAPSHGNQKQLRIECGELKLSLDF